MLTASGVPSFPQRALDHDVIAIRGKQDADSRASIKPVAIQSVRPDQPDTVGLGLRQQPLHQLLVIDHRLIHGIECFGHHLASPPSSARRVAQTPINR
ncbi:MAG: hypothetical protein ACXVXO_09635 [Mycobacteriaceae bacterium]